MAKGSFASDLKKTAAKNIGKSIAKTGLIGGALGKAFAKKFGSEEKEDTQVADALQEQTDAQDHNNATLERLESIVMNIADNVYNIAAVWSEHVTSMKEAQRHQKEEEFKRQALQEENAAEALKVGSPSTAAAADKPKQGEDKKGILGSILGSVGSTKSMFKSVLQKFALVAGGALAATAAVAALTSAGSADEGKAKDLEQAAEEAGSTEKTTGAGATPTDKTVDTASGTAPASSTSSNTTAAALAGKTTDTTTGTATSSASTAGATPASPPPPAAATISSPGASTPTPTPSATPTATAAVPPPSVTATKESTTVADVIKEPADVATNGITLAAPGGPLTFPDKETIQYWQEGKKTVSVNIGGNNWVFKNAESFNTWQEAAVATAKKASPTSVTPTPSGGGGGGEGPAGGAMAAGGGGDVAPSGASGGGGSSGGGESGAAPVTPKASSGSDVGAASVAVAAASEQSKQNTTQTVDVGNGPVIEPPPAMGMPTTIAERGSLDVGTTFDSAGSI